MNEYIYIPPLGPDWNISKTIGCIAMQFWANIHCSQRMNLTDVHDPHDFFSVAPPWGSLFFIEMSKNTAEWIAMKSGTNIPVSLRMNSKNLGDPLTFPLASSSGRFSPKIHVKTIKFSSVLAVLLCLLQISQC